MTILYAHLTRSGDYQSPAFNAHFRFREILHFVQNDKSEVRHPEHSEGSRGNEDAFNLTLPFAPLVKKGGGFSHFCENGGIG